MEKGQQKYIRSKFFKVKEPTDIIFKTIFTVVYIFTWLKKQRKYKKDSVKSLFPLLSPPTQFSLPNPQNRQKHC